MRSPRSRDTTRAIRWPAAIAVAAVMAASCGGSDDPLSGVTVTSAGDSSELIVVEFADEADLSDPPLPTDWGDRGREVVRRLEATAEEAQRAARSMVDDAGLDATSFWVTNALVVEGDADLADRLGRLPGVSSVYLEPLHPHVTDPAFGEVATDEVPATTWNVDSVGAPEAWSTGHDGTGAVVGVIDSGVDVTHPALTSSWHGDDGWFDATGSCGSNPCDPVGHGTHVAGIAIGGDAGSDATPQIGVAPGASFVAAKACGPDGCVESDLLAAAQWMLQPGDEPGARPQVLVNSWDLAPGDTSLDRLPGVWRAAGQVPVFAAGNDGPSCASVGSPAEQVAAIAVGALARDTSVDRRTSRGPGSNGARKPDLWAPGLGIISSLPGGGYGTGDGTSMAAPHVAGAVAVRLGSSRDTAGLTDDLLTAATILPGVPTCTPDTNSTDSTTTAPSEPVGDSDPRSLDVSTLIRDVGR